VTTSYEYNDDGIRVRQTVDDGSPVTTVYHIDPNNHTGYSQVLEQGVDDGDGELEVGEIDRTFTLGHDVIAQTAPSDGVTLPGGSTAGDPLYFLYDGHGSTRALLNLAILAPSDPAAAILQRFAYDAYGNPLGFATADALTALLYSGEQTDLTGLQYLRARYYNPANGRFNRLDPFAGNINDPVSLHKYLYTHGDPIQGIDPSGQFLAMLSISFSLGSLRQVVAATVAIGVLYKLTTILDHVAYGRLPTAAELATINSAIALVDGNTDVSIANKAKLISKEVIDFDEGSWAKTRPFASYEILLTDELLGFVDVEFIASTIIHETLHTFQAPIYSSSFWGEKAAYQLQSDFLKRIGISGTREEIQIRFPRTRPGYLKDLAQDFEKHGIHEPAITP
jgi:RHS repeat-associated protein